MNLKKLNCLFVLSVLLVLGFATGTSAQDDEIHELAGTTAASWLKIGVGARAAGMGGSYTAICDDASAIFWNPAKLSRVRNTQVMTQYGLWLAQMKYHAVSFTIPIIPKKKSEVSSEEEYESESGYEEEPYSPRRRSRYSDYSRYDPYYFAYSYAQPRMPQKEVVPPGGTIGVGISYFDYGNIPGYDETGNPGKDFTANSYCAMLSYSHALGEAIGIGITAKMISETIDTETATAFAGDAGLSLTAGSESGKFCLAVVMQNMGATLAGSALPETTRAGVGIELGPFTISGDYSMPKDHAPKINAGAEFKLGGMMAFRAGMVAMDDVGGKGLFGLSAGFGLDMGGLYVDVAYVPFGDYLGDTIRASILLSF